MIQAMNNKNLAKVLLGNQGETNVIDPEVLLENLDFANELAANMTDLDLMKVAPVEVHQGQELQIPSDLIQFPDAGMPQTIDPNVFDSTLTEGVDGQINPKTTNTETPFKSFAPVNLEPALTTADSSLAPVDPEAEQVLLKNPQINTLGRSPAIDFAKTEVDPQLESMEDFIAQKNMVAKKPSTNSAYGMNKASINKLSQESGLKSTQLVGDASAASDGGAGASGRSMNSQQFILGLNAEQSTAPKPIDSIQAPIKTFDMSHIKTENTNQIMNQITDYIVQAKTAKEPTVNMRVNHEDLGIIDITVQKSVGQNNEAIAVNIGTHSVDGKNFFQTNSKDLFSHLTNAGLNLTELKVETPTQTAKNDFDFNGQSKGGFGQDKQFNSESNQRRHDTDRRQELWNKFKDKEAA